MHVHSCDYQFNCSLSPQNDHTVDFHLANCLDYIKAGVGSIIEDEVTSRFEAEELKNWNLLTRTNRYHEFISWRLSIIWFIGFFIRYFILMPFRVIICFVGVSWACLMPLCLSVLDRSTEPMKITSELNELLCEHR